MPDDAANVMDDGTDEKSMFHSYTYPFHIKQTIEENDYT